MNYLEIIKNYEAEAQAERLLKLKTQLAKDKNSLLGAAKTIESQYEKEILEGTEKKKLLIENGKARGLTEEQILNNLAIFIPSKNTPILNMLYFLTRENPDVNDSIKVLREQLKSDANFNELKKSLNEEFGNQQHDIVDADIPNILEYIYKNVTTDIFDKIKKLKTLATNQPSSAEQYAAYGKAMELCQKYNLDYNRIPTNVD